MKLIKTFEPFFQSLRDLPFWAQLAATELIISHRDGVTSVCYVTEDLFSFIKLVGDVPQLIREADTERYFVDLERFGFTLKATENVTKRCGGIMSTTVRFTKASNISATATGF